MENFLDCISVFFTTPPNRELVSNNSEPHFPPTLQFRGLGCKKLWNYVTDVDWWIRPSWSTPRGHRRRFYLPTVLLYCDYWSHVATHPVAVLRRTARKLRLFFSQPRRRRASAPPSRGPRGAVCVGVHAVRIQWDISARGGRGPRVSRPVNVKWQNVNSRRHKEGQAFEEWLCLDVTNVSSECHRVHP